MPKESFGNWFDDACKAAGVPGSAHGLRKAGATRAARTARPSRNLGPSSAGRDDAMASLYTRSADPARLAIEARSKLARTKTENLFPHPPRRCGMRRRKTRKSIRVENCGAVKRTRTSTPVKELAPQASASTSSAMTARFALRHAGAKRRRSSNKSLPRRQAIGDDGAPPSCALRASCAPRVKKGEGSTILPSPRRVTTLIPTAAAHNRGRHRDPAGPWYGPGGSGR